MTNVLIAGCGYLGTTLGVLLDRLGHDVTGLRRDPSGLPAPIKPLAADLTRPDTLRVPDTDWLVFAVAADARTEEAYRAAYPRALANLLDAFEERPPERVVFVSSTAVYGQADGEWVDEDSPTEPEGFNGRVLLEAEALLDECPSRTTSLRLGGIYGPGRTRLVESVLNGEMDLPAGPAAHTNRIHRDDAALAIVHLLELDEPDSIYNGVDRDPADRREVLTWLADRLDVPRPTVGSGTSASSRGNKRVKSDRLVESGFEFRYPTFREGYESVIAGLGASHWSPGEFGE